jgi:hypothetical protein
MMVMELEDAGDFTQSTGGVGLGDGWPDAKRTSTHTSSVASIAGDRMHRGPLFIRAKLMTASTRRFAP